MHTEVRDPDNHLILSRIYTAEGEFYRNNVYRKVYAGKIYQTILDLLETGRISFTSQAPGEHTICVFTNSTAWFGGQQLRVHLEMETGEHAVNYAQVAQEEKLSEIQLRIRQLLNQIDQILREQNYQRVR